MFSVKIVKECPVTGVSQGVISFSKEHIAMIAGAVRDKDEWMLFLNGQRSEDGYNVTVERITVPPQYRAGAHVELAEIDLANDVVGVMHSHHRMGAFFSGTDQDHLNPRFPSSIVVAIASNNLGFSYKAEGKVVLPCGSVGVVEFVVEVREAGERFAGIPVKGTHAMVSDGARLGDCDQFKAESGEFTLDVSTACGLRKEVDRPMVFGIDGGTELLKVIEGQALVRPAPPPNQYGAYYGANYGNSTYTGNGGYQTRGNTGSNGKLTKKQRKQQAKLSARRNGLVKMERPEGKSDGLSTNFEELAKRNQQAGSGYTFKGGCDDCEIRGERLRKHWESDQWLCLICYAWRERVEQFAAEDEADDNAGNCWVDADGKFHLIEDEEEEVIIVDGTVITDACIDNGNGTTTALIRVGTSEELGH